MCILTALGTITAISTSPCTLLLPRTLHMLAPWNTATDHFAGLNRIFAGLNRIFVGLNRISRLYRGGLQVYFLLWPSNACCMQKHFGHMLMCQSTRRIVRSAISCCKTKPLKDWSHPYTHQNILEKTHKRHTHMHDTKTTNAVDTLTALRAGAAIAIVSRTLFSPRALRTWTPRKTLTDCFDRLHHDGCWRPFWLRRYRACCIQRHLYDHDDIMWHKKGLQVWCGVHLCNRSFEGVSTKSNCEAQKLTYTQRHASMCSLTALGARFAIAAPPCTFLLPSPLFRSVAHFKTSTNHLIVCYKSWH